MFYINAILCFSTDDYLDYGFGGVIQNVPIIGYGTVVEILTTRCDGSSECWGSKDEEHCGFSTLVTSAIGNFVSITVKKYLPIDFN